MLPYAFTEREATTLHADFAKRLTELEMKTEGLEIAHGTFSHKTRLQLRQILDAIRELTMPSDPLKRPMGFVPPQNWQMS